MAARTHARHYTPVSFTQTLYSTMLTLLVIFVLLTVSNMSGCAFCSSSPPACSPYARRLRCLICEWVLVSRPRRCSDWSLWQWPAAADPRKPCS